MLSRLRTFTLRLWGLFTRRRFDRELDQEFQAHLDMLTERLVRQGLPEEEAQYAARRQFGGITQMKEELREHHSLAFLDSMFGDIRYAFRQLRKAPAFAAATILTLALGIGATTAIFSLLDAVILKSLPVKNPQELVLVKGVTQYPAFQVFQQYTDIFSNLFASSGVTLLDVQIQNGVGESADVSLVSGDYFSTLGIRAAVGRTFTADDDRVQGEHPVAVASYGYWQRRFGRDATIVGRIVRIGGTPITIIGVAPPGFFGEQVGVAPDLWVPLTMWGQIVPGRNLLQSPGTGWLQIIGRLRPGMRAFGQQPVLTERYQRVLTEIFGAMPSSDLRRDIAKAVVTLEPASKGISSLRGRFARPLQLMMGAVALLLLIACANIATLLLARATARRREIDVRLALGMSQARLIRQLLTESLVLAALGGAGGVGLAWMVREVLLRLISADGSRLPVPVATDARLLVFVAVISLATAMLFGLAPAWQTARVSTITSPSCRGSVGRTSPRLRTLLVIAQIAVSLVLLMSAGLFLRTIANLRDVDLGFAPERLLIIDVGPQPTGYGAQRGIALNRRLLDALNVLPGISSASLSENGVLMGRDNTTNLIRPRGFIAGPEGFPRSHWDVVGPRYFSTMGIPLLAGRDFSDRDDIDAPHVVAINDEMARRFFVGVDPVGRRLIWNVGNGHTELQIIAVTRDVKQSGPRDEPELRFYLPYFQLAEVRPNWMLASTRFVVRTASDPIALAPMLRRVIPSLDARFSIRSVEIGPELLNRTLVRERMVATLLLAFGVLALALACLGLYGLIAYNVVQRTGEIGIRMALGAQRIDVLWETLQRALTWIAAGVAAGIPLALSASQAAQGLLFGLSATDGGALIGAAGLLSAMGLLAAYIPARRATKIDPMQALRCE